MYIFKGQTCDTFLENRSLKLIYLSICNIFYENNTLVLSFGIQVYINIKTYALKMLEISFNKTRHGKLKM